MTHLQQTFDHLLALLGDVRNEVLEVTAADLLEELGLVLCAEGVIALEEDVEEDSE